MYNNKKNCITFVIYNIHVNAVYMLDYTIHVDIYHDAHYWSISHFHVHCRSFCMMGLSPALLPASSHSFSLA